jgi:hypothetical protein
VAELLTCVLTTFQLAAADLEADVLGLDVDIGTPLLLPSLGSLFLARAAMLAALVSAAVELSLANSEAQWRVVDVALVTNPTSCCPSAAAGNVHVLEARSASPGVTLVLARVAARECLAARFFTMRNRVPT